MRRRFALIVLLGALALTVQAQSPPVRVSLHGHVVAADTGAPLRNARVQAATTNQPVPPAFTDADGRFAISVADNASFLAVTKPGYLSTMFPAPRADGEIEMRLRRRGDAGEARRVAGSRSARGVGPERHAPHPLRRRKGDRHAARGHAIGLPGATAIEVASVRFTETFEQRRIRWVIDGSLQSARSR